MFWSVVYLVWAFFVSKAPVTLENALDGLMYSLFSGAYYHFWFIYLIVGLYLLTPILRVIVAYNNPKIIWYFVILWFINVAVFPLIEFVTGYSLHDSLFVLSGFVGYFVLGTYLQRIQLRSSFLYGLFFLSLIFTIASTWIVTFHYPSEGQTYFFFEYLSLNVIIESTILFIILSRLNVNWKRGLSSIVYPVIGVIGKNTLPIYLLHIIVMETLQRGYLGFKLSITTINPFIGIPLIALITLLATLVLVLIMKKIPLLKRVIG